MRGEEVDRVELVGVDADGVHERQGAIDLGADALVALADRAVLDEVGVPLVHLAQVGVTTGGERAREVQRRRGRVVDLDEPLRVVRARLGVEVEAVDGIAAVGRQGHAVAGLGVARARLGVLAGKTADLDDRNARGVRQHDRHRQQDAELVADVLGRDALERLGAVATLEQERLAAGHLGELVAQRIALAGEHQRGHRAELLHGSIARSRVDVGRLLGGAERAKLIKGGNAHEQRLRGSGRLSDARRERGLHRVRPRHAARQLAADAQARWPGHDARRVAWLTRTGLRLLRRARGGRP